MDNSRVACNKTTLEVKVLVGGLLHNFEEVADPRGSFVLSLISDIDFV